jgi:tRNA G46 methylase TrmB
LSLYYYDLARWLFISLAFSGILSTGWFGIPLVPKYFLYGKISITSGLFTLFSALGTIWGVLAYNEFTKSANLLKESRELARNLDPLIGDYEYKSYNPETKEYEEGYVPLGPVDFWDRETQVPSWLDKGKYWRILLGFQSLDNKEIRLQVVRDRDLPLMEGRRNVAVTFKEHVIGTGSRRRSRHRYVYRIKIPQWIVMNTERLRFADRRDSLNLDDVELSSVIADLNRRLVAAADEIIEHEKPRIQYPLSIASFGIYLNKSLPIRIIYREVVRHFPGSKKRTIDYANANLANIKDYRLIEVIIEMAIRKGIPADRIYNIRSLIQFLKNAYFRQGLGEGSSEYHNFHHSLEVSYLCLQILSKQFRGYEFTAKDYELILVAGLLHDYDPIQMINSKHDNNRNGIQRGPKVYRTVNEICNTRILDAYFTMNASEFENYFREYRSAVLQPIEFATTHPEYVKLETDNMPAESAIVKALIWHTDFPYNRRKQAREKFMQLVSSLNKQEHDTGKIELLGEVLWIADLAVTYMGSDPIRAWDRVTNLYDELNLPKNEAVSRTDAFFSDFAETSLFKELISMRQFPEIFRQRWNMVYQFFHEGNPSTQINRMITKTKNLYLRVNLELYMRTGDMLYEIASNNWAEYFIGIGRDQNEVLRSKSKFVDLDPPNASAFWGDTQKLLPNIVDKSIDNFMLVLPQNLVSKQNIEQELSLRSTFAILPSKLADEGTLQILTDLEANDIRLRDIIEIILDVGFEGAIGRGRKIYFPKGWKDPWLIEGTTPHVLLFQIKKLETHRRWRTG